MTGERKRPRLLWYLKRRPEAVDAEIEEELRLHLELRIEALEARGLPRDAARREAMRQFGDSAEYQEMARNMASEARKQMWGAFSFGFGLYLALGASLYLAWLGFRSARGGSPAPHLQAA